MNFLQLFIWFLAIGIGWLLVLVPIFKIILEKESLRDYLIGSIFLFIISIIAKMVSDLINDFGLYQIFFVSLMYPIIIAEIGLTGKSIVNMFQSRRLVFVIVPVILASAMSIIMLYNMQK